jgi:ribose-phosphate pyrophosphokinase
MSDSSATSIVVGFPDYREQAQRLGAAAGIAYDDVRVHRFPDGESLVTLPATLPSDVVIYTSLDDANRRLIELEFAAATALQLGARRLTLVAPYLCYMRQDIAFHRGESVSQRIVGELLARHFDTLITVDPHLHRTHSLADAIPVRRAIALSAAPAIADWLKAQGGEPLLIGPDEESGQWVSAIAAPGGFDCDVAQKTRIADDEVRVELPDRSYRGRDVVLVDDVASTGHTLAEAARQIAEQGAASVRVVVTHALFTGDALELLRQAGVTDICSTDSIRHQSNRLHLDRILARALNGDQEGAMA